MKRISTRTVTQTALFIALGILIPIGFHAAGLGKLFLPMHLPVLLAGLLCGPLTGLFTGALTPLLSAVLTGMPTLTPPVAQTMMFELGIYGLLSGIMRHSFKLSVVTSLLGAMLLGRLVYGFLGALILPTLGLPRIPILYPLITSLLSSLPGVLLQLILIPLIVSLVQRSSKNRVGGGG
ncbi:MAG TPA: ECF transporter S component [Firmicutes bacterium]|nr:ECF transporter S component [Bacillota bacterium]